MELLKCKICGGDIDISLDKTIGTCSSCGCTTTIPKIDDDQKVGLFNRGNMLRMRGEFDKASVVFERIVELDETNAEAHWCLALCRYGIEYVEDPKSGERIPTCHRTSYNAFLNDMDYMAAIEHSDSYTASIYTEEAKKIAEIQKSILSISKQEEPFDVFICYKETSNGGSRTKESIIAQDIYYELTNVGYKVFFSRLTLEEKLGIEYEPYIFAALNSAKVMVVIGTSAENFNATWVKNEWSRFLSIMKGDKTRMLIPCYRDMDPYDLPDELAMLQSQDMSKIGFIQDIIRGIRKVLESATVKKISMSSVDTPSTNTLERLILNSNTYLRLDNYPAAQEVFNRITKEYPEDYRGWWGLIICQTKNLSVFTQDISAINTWLKYVKELSEAEEYYPLEAQYVTYIKIQASSDADNEISAIEESLDSLNARMKLCVEAKKQEEQIKMQQEEAFCEQMSDCDRIISNKEQQIAYYVEQRVKPTGLVSLIAGVVFLVLAALLFYLGRTESDYIGGFKIIGVSIGAIGIALLFTPLSDKKEKEKVINDARLCLGEAEKNKKETEVRYNVDVKKTYEKIEIINSEIAKLEEQIAEYKKYLAYGKDKITEIFLAKRCKSIGIDRPADSEMDQLRERLIKD